MKKINTILILLLLSAAGLSAKVVDGTVKCGKERLQGVIVTDGTNFTVTDKKGKFSLNISDKADFVHIVTPSGYTAPFGSGTPLFYIPADSRSFDFQLLRTADSEDYAIIAVADPQTAHEKHFAEFQQKVMPDLMESVNAEKERFFTIGLTLGDICWDNMPLLQAYKEEMAKTGIPFYPVIGNHDHNKDMQGDHSTSSSYRETFGPENYAFGIGNDYVIVLDNIVYDTQKKYVEGYTESILDWVKTLLSFIPSESRIYIAQHSPNICPGERYTLNSRKMLDILKGRKADFISGHTHISYNLIVTPEIMEHNVAASCGSWWVTGHCTDGTPGGYKIFENDSRGLTWYYKSIGHDRGYQIETFNLGQSIRHPNAVLANVWDYDPEWKVEWYQDGKYMGEMEQAEDMSPEYIREIHSVYTDRGKEIPGYKQPDWSDHYFMAVPDVYAKEVKICVTDRYGNTYESVENLRDFTDVQAHRGGAGLMPENTISSMKNAIDLGVNTLELDLQISADKQVVVSHDAYFHPRYATRPDGSTVRPEDPKEYIYTMPYSEVAKYDTGLRQSEVWPEKANIAEHKPLADELIGFVEKYTADNGLTPMRYNIEIKSKAGKTEGVNWPEYREFVDRCAELLLSKGLGDRLVVQSFDVRALNYMHEKYPQLVLSYLVDAKEPDFDKYMSLINFTPVWLSPHYTIVDEELCRKCSEKGIKLVPWTVDTPEDIQRMIDLKVEAIISNYPDRLLKATRGYIHPDK